MCEGESKIKLLPRACSAAIETKNLIPFSNSSIAGL